MGIFSFRRALLIAGITLAVALAANPSARAFYWPNWPGSGTSDPSTSSTADPAVISTTSPIVTTTGDPADPVDPIIDPGAQTPEPSTLIAGLIGLAFVGLTGRKMSRSRLSESR